MSQEPVAIRLPNGKLLSRQSSRDDIWACRRDAIMGKLEPREDINLVTYGWLNEPDNHTPGNGPVLETTRAAYGEYVLKEDYPLFAIYDPACYQSFVSNFWDWETLQFHLAQQMQYYHILICSAGMQGDWRIKIQHEPVLLAGAREASGSIMAAGSRLILCDYGHLTMGAQFSDIKLPDDEPFGAYEIKVRPGTFNVRVIQMNLEPGIGDGPDIILEILQAQRPLLPWFEIAWNEMGRMGI